MAKEAKKPKEAEDNAVIQEPPVIAEPVIPVAPAAAEQEEDPRKLVGKIVELGYGVTIWRSSSASGSGIELNAFTGKVTAKIPKGMTDFYLAEISRGIKYGRLRITEEERQTSPVTTREGSMDTIHSVNIFLDEKKLSVFEQNVKRTASVSFLSTCLSVEEGDRNRPEYKKILLDKLKVMS